MFMEIGIVGPGGTRDLLIKQPIGFGTGGFYIREDSTTYYIDPGPGAVLKINRQHPDLQIDSIICSHFHLDHYGDLLATIEYSTNLERKVDLISTDDVYRYIDQYHKKFINYINYKNFKNTFPIDHGIDGFGIYLEDLGVYYTSDGKFHNRLLNVQADILIANIAVIEPTSIKHMSLQDLKKFIDMIKPKHVIISHYSIYLLKRLDMLMSELTSSYPDIKFYTAKEGDRYVF